MPIEKVRPAFHFEAERIEQLKQIVPEAFADGKINWESLQEALGEFLEEAEPGSEHFGLFWPGKKTARKIASIPSEGTLIPCPGEGIDEENTSNIFIEGENLEVLKLLQKSYANRIKMIYIDPPYNTGNDFIYDDNFTESIDEYLRRTGQMDEESKPLSANKKSDGRFHSKWLSMMYPRLRLARNLLKDEGLIFISIDDNEVHNLIQLCNEVFGEENQVAHFIWRRRKTQANLSKFIAPVHDYILCFCKNKNNLVFNRIPFSKEYIESSFSNPDNDPRGVYQTGPLARPENSSNKRYELTMPNGRKIKAKWSCSQQTFDQYVKENRLVIPRGGEGMPRIKIFLNELSGLLPNTWLDNIATNEEGSKEIEEYFGSNAYFTAPKPTGLIRHLLNLGISDNEIILDFFGGSGTTGDSVYRYNYEFPNANISYLLVQLDEPLSETSEAYKKKYRKISEITLERLKASSKRIKKLSKNRIDFGFRYFQLQRSNFKASKNYAGSNIKELELQFENDVSPLANGWSTQNLVTEIMLIEGFPLDSKAAIQSQSKKNEVTEITSNFCEHKLLVCLDKKVYADTIKSLQLNDEDIFICLDSAITDQDKVTLQDKGLIKTI